VRLSTPPPDEDPIQQLYIYYFELADLMFGHYFKLYELIEKKGRLSKANERKFQQYAQLWLATLYVVAEAFHKDERLQKHFERCKEHCPESNMHWRCIQHQIGQFENELRVFRNATFHFQSSVAKHRRFLELTGPRRPLQWARALHKEMQEFFAQYRIEGTVLFYLTKGEDLAKAS
jgi:hypothetical protein